MFRHLLSGSVFAGICTLLLACSLTQAQSSKDPAPVAFVYVSSQPDGGKNVIDEFAAAANGRLTEVPGSPYGVNAEGLSIDGDRLYAANNSVGIIESFLIRSNGALHYLTSTNFEDVPSFVQGKECGQVGYIYPDRSGADLYMALFNGDCGSNDFFEAFTANNSNGSIKLLSKFDTGFSSPPYLPASFLGNNRFAYSADNNGCMFYELWGFERASNGNLTVPNITAKFPAPPSGSTRYIADITATDASDHVAIALQAASPPSCSDLNPRLASFTANSKGDLTTTNTNATMPSSINTTINDMKISPAGNLLAVGGEQGLQVFHFNGAKPPTPYTGIVTVDPVTEMFWDSSNHLYVISQSAGRLHVFTITASSYHEASGSPYPITNPQYVAVYVK
jgi:hypothetical protein